MYVYVVNLIDCADMMLFINRKQSVVPGIDILLLLFRYLQSSNSTVLDLL